MADFDDEELVRRQQKHAEELEGLNQEQRLQQQEEEERPNQRVDQLKSAAKDQAKKQVKKVAKKAIGRAIMATAPYWGTALLIILGIMLVLSVVIIIPVVACNSSYSLTDWDINALKAFIAIIPGDVCSALDITTPPVAPAPTSINQPIYALDIVITGAYRAGAVVYNTNRLSAHGRGEAVDIALRNPRVPIGSSDPRIGQLIAIAEAAGFTPAAGDTLNEYAKPQCNPSDLTCAGHVHVEFNLKPDGTTYCDGTRVPALGPVDLTYIPSNIPVQGAKDPRVRSCMLAPIQAIFTAAKNATKP